LWVFELSDQDKSFNVTAANLRSYQLRAVSEANARFRLGGAAASDGRTAAPAGGAR
jgi:hypothetical protein